MSTLTECVDKLLDGKSKVTGKESNTNIVVLESILG